MSHEILSPTFQRVDERGNFVEVLNSGQWEALLYGEMNRGTVIGNHYHKKTEIFFFLKSGRTEITTIHVETNNREKLILTNNQGVKLKTNESHAIHFLENSEFIMLKSLPYNPDDLDTFPYPIEI